VERFKNILLLYDNTSAFEDAKKLSLRLAKKNKAALTVLEVLPGLGDYVELLSSMFSSHRGLEAAEEEAEAELKEIFAPEISAGVDLRTAVIRGRAAFEATRYVIEKGQDLLIKSADSENSSGSSAISTLDMRLLRKCPCPVWIVKKGTAGKLKRIAAAIDNSFEDEKRRNLNADILKLGWGISRMGKGALDVLNVWDFDSSSLLRGSVESSDFAGYDAEASKEHRDRLRRFINETLPKLKPECICSLRGRTSECILHHVRDNSTDVLVMGTVARSGVPGLLIGNTAEGILSRIGCSVLAIKPQGFVSPVLMEGIG
jgi:universal stress protein E